MLREMRMRFPLDEEDDMPPKEIHGRCRIVSAEKARPGKKGSQAGAQRNGIIHGQHMQEPPSERGYHGMAHRMYGTHGASREGEKIFFFFFPSQRQMV